MTASIIEIPNAQAGTITATGATIAYARASLGQSFTMPANISGTVSTLFVGGIRGRSSSNIVCVQAKIYTSSAKSSLLETSSNSVCDTDATGTETTGLAATDSFIFSNTVNLVAATQYFFELTITSGSTAFWTNQAYSVANGGSYSGGQLFADGVFKPDYDMNFTLTYTDGPDLVAPTFNSSNSFSAAENISTTAAAATIKVSESATVTISSGVDAALFTISNSDSVTALIKFKVSPDYEAPSDSGANNVYDLVLTATDPSNNAGTQTITITVTDVLDTSSFNSFALAGGVSSVTYRASIQINASVTVASKITFKASNVVIPGCKSISATGSGSTFTVSCSWKPSKRGGVALTATSTPNNGSISGATATPLNVLVVNRTGPR